jgi:hypothetical protein
MTPTFLCSCNHSICLRQSGIRSDRRTEGLSFSKGSSHFDFSTDILNGIRFDRVTLFD